jgi:hypothetical protein
MMSKLPRHLLGLMLVLALAACASDDADKNKDADKKDKDKKEAEKEQATPICPQVAILRELEAIQDYGNEKPDPGQLVAKAKMRSVDGTCAYRKDGIDVAFDLNFVAAKGPRLGGLHIGFPYFIAVVGSDDNILNKERMTVEFGFSSSSEITERAESLHVFIPLPKDKRVSGPSYRVLMGFQLTQEQLDTARGNVPDIKLSDP